MKNMKIWIALIAFVVVVGIVAGVYIATRPEVPVNEPTDPTLARYFTLIVVHGDGSEKTFELGTDKTYLSEALLDEKLIVESSSPGMYTTVDGETADWNVNQSYWGFYVGEDYATEGMDTTVIQNGATYKLVYTVG